MAKYFEELSKLKDFNVYIMEDNDMNKSIPLDFYKKHHEIFEYIKDINNIGEFKLYNETYKITDIKERYLRQFKIVDLIKRKYFLDNNDLYDLLIGNNYDNILKLITNIDTINCSELKGLISFYYRLLNIANPFNDKSVAMAFKMAIEELNDIEKIYGKKLSIIKLPNYWYILPSFHELDERLYNTTGENAHREANLNYPYYKALNGILLNPQVFVDKVKNIDENGVSINDYIKYVGYGLNSYVNLMDDPLENDIKLHMNNNKIVVSGSVMAEGLLWDYFNKINSRSKDYKESLEVFKKVILDDFLVRILGFHKIIMRGDKKIIATSNLDYEDEFIEYTSNGFDIDFTTPLKYNYDKNQIEEIDNSFMKLKQFHMD